MSGKYFKTTVVTCLATASFAAQAIAADVKFDGTLSWTAYGVGSSGYSQSVAIGKALQDAYGVSLRVVPAKNDVSRLTPIRDGRINFSAAGSGVFYAAEGVQAWIKPDLGPQPLRMVMSSSGNNCLALGTAADAKIVKASDLKGKRLSWVVGSPALQTNVTAFMAFGGVTWGDVEKVEVPGFAAAWKAMVNDQSDAMSSFTTGGEGEMMTASPRGLRWLSLPHSDEEGWARLQKVAPHMTKRKATLGVGLSKEKPLECAGFPYPILITYPKQEAGLVYNMAKAVSDQYKNFSKVEPSAAGWADERQKLSWVLPYHEGAVKYWKERGMWTKENQAHNEYLLKRQRILADTWQNIDKDGDDLPGRWMKARTAAFQKAGFDPIWTE